MASKLPLETIEHILSAISPALTNSGLVCKISESSRWNFDEKKDPYISITDPTREFFRAEIVPGNAWNKEGQASLWLTTDYTDSYQVPNYYRDGSPNTISNRYEFDNYISDTDLEAMGIEKESYRYTLSSLRLSFKATKSAKLICNDVLPRIETYRKAYDLAMPAILATIEKRQYTLKLQNYVDSYGEYRHGVQELKGSRSTEINGVGKVTVSEHGEITLERSISEAELRQLLQANEVAAA